MIYYQSEMDDLLVQAELFIELDENSLNALRTYKKAYVAYQAAAVTIIMQLNKNL